MNHSFSSSFGHTERKDGDGSSTKRSNVNSEHHSTGGSERGSDSSSSELGYDMNIVFRSHASNIPHITRWIDELVSMTERGKPTRKFPTTENLVDSLQRYDAVYRELLRQTSIFSEPVTKMLAKVWAGALKLLDYMVKSYHRYVKHTSNLQDQASILLSEKQQQMISMKVREDEFDLEKTYLKAKIRNLEAQIESMAATKREMDRENDSLRGILSRYVQSEGMNTPVWDVTNEDADNNPAPGYEPAEKDVVDQARLQLRELSRIEIEMNETLGLALREEDKQMVVVKDIMDLLERNQNIFGKGSSSMGKWIPGAVDKRTFKEMGVQVDEKEQFGIVTDLAPENPEDMGVPAPMTAKLPRARLPEIPYLLRKEMKTQPQVLRIAPAAWLCQSIMAIYMDKITVDAERVAKGLPKQHLPAHIYDYYRRQLHMDALADAIVAQLVRACEHHCKTLPRAALFASQIGLYEKEKPPSMDVRDTDFVLSVVSSLMDLGELVEEKASRRKLTKRSVIVKPDILRSAALKTVENLFHAWLPDGGQDFLQKVKAMAHTDKGSKYVDVDEFIEILIEPWHNVRTSWEEHVSYLFREHCVVFRVLQEAAFANDNGIGDKDTLLSQLSKASAKDCTRRSVRAFQVFVGAGRSDSDGSRKGPDSGAQKEPVCEAFNRKVFINVLLIIQPKMSVADAEKLFEQSLSIAHTRVLRDLELMWVRLTHKRSQPDLEGEKAALRRGNHNPVPPIVTEIPYYYNMKTGLTQWAKPYRSSTFRARDIEYETFLAALIQNDLLANSPLADLLHMTPKDLWPNADMFLKMKKKEQEKSKGAA